MTDLQIISSALAETGRSRILVLGDYALDKYLYIDPARDEPSVETLTADMRISPAICGHWVRMLPVSL